MPQYQLELSHSEQECLTAANMIVSHGMHLMNHTWFGCNAGVHVGWLNLEVDNEREARGMLPPTLRNQARVVEVERFSPVEAQDTHT